LLFDRLFRVYSSSLRKRTLFNRTRLDWIHVSLRIRLLKTISFAGAGMEKVTGNTRIKLPTTFIHPTSHQSSVDKRQLFPTNREVRYILVSSSTVVNKRMKYYRYGKTIHLRDCKPRRPRSFHYEMNLTHTRWSNYTIFFFSISRHFFEQASPIYQPLEILQEHGIVMNDIQKLQNAGYHTIESVCLL
jgi:hypothetical protein